VLEKRANLSDPHVWKTWLEKSLYRGGLFGGTSLVPKSVVNNTFLSFLSTLFCCPTALCMQIYIRKAFISSVQP
jgi:hypothetical protein